MGLDGVFDGSGDTVVAGLLMIVEKWKRIVGQQLRYFWFFFFLNSCGLWLWLVWQRWRWLLLLCWFLLRQRVTIGVCGLW